ncbi:ABC transporter permease [Anaerolineales bacterium HSG6]|nr:ABC transporter permease [Anaerolineales bacterium HSG6]MDM8529933.1 ABC transporter permease [Anaerolineales bacterium HSG25]
MKRIWLIFWHEYWSHLTRRAYLMFTFGFPAMLIGMPLVGGALLAGAIFMAMPAPDTRPIGIVDQVNLLLEPEEQVMVISEGAIVKSQEQAGNLVHVIFFRSPEEAASALATDYIQAYYKIPPDYWESGDVIVTYYTAPNELLETMVSSWIRREVEEDIPREFLFRLRFGPDIAHTSALSLDEEETTSNFSMINFVEGAIVYMIIYFVRLVGTSFTANYMFDSISNEADDRTLEILITSISPLQFLLGKVFGILAVGVTQLLTWAGLVFIVFQSMSLIAGFNMVGLLLGWPHLWLLISMLAGAYMMDHLLAAAMGLLRVSGGAGMQLFSLVNLASGFGLLYATYLIPRNPHTWLAIGASLFPITSPIVLMIRVVVSDVPQWQIISAQVLLWLTNIVALIWLQRLLRANLVANRQPFKLGGWLKRKFWALWGRVPSVRGV